MARPRKPTAVKKLQGTLQPCRTNQNEPNPQIPLQQIEPPRHLSTIAKNAWRFALSQAPTELLTSLDFATFEQWCITYAELVEVQKVLKREGLTFLNEDTGLSMAHPLIKTQMVLQDTLRRYMTEMGFTPASRSKISIAKQDEKNNDFLDL